MSHVLTLAAVHALHWVVLIISTGFTLYFFDSLLEAWHPPRSFYGVSLTLATFLFMVFTTVFIYYFGSMWINILTLHGLL